MQNIKYKTPITSLWPKTGSLSFEEYVSRGGFEAISNVLSGKFHPLEIIEEIENSGLQGRGGGGFPTGMKWRMCREAAEKSDEPNSSDQPKAYIICNADESEPGTYKDRLIIEKNPFMLLEGMIIGAWAIGATKGYIYLNGIYNIAEHTLKNAIKKLEENNWLGEKIQGTEFTLHLSVFSGAGSYVCGEESALINTITGSRGEPTIKPPYPIEKGLFGRPTLVNNAETFSQVPYIIKEGASAFKSASISQQSFGSKLFILNGAVNVSGVYEAPLGITLRELIENYAGGIKKLKTLECVQVGGSSGSLFKESDLDRPLGYHCENEISVGSGAILVIDKSQDLKKLLLAWSSFFKRESCGKCVPCREGTYQLFLLAERINNNSLREGDRERLEDLIFTMQKTSFCPLGAFATKSWESILKHYSDLIPE